MIGIVLIVLLVCVMVGLMLYFIYKLNTRRR